MLARSCSTGLRTCRAGMRNKWMSVLYAIVWVGSPSVRRCNELLMLLLAAYRVSARHAVLVVFRAIAGAPPLHAHPEPHLRALQELDGRPRASARGGVHTSRRA